MVKLLKHIESFHLQELSDKGLKNLCRYIVKKSVIAQELLPPFTDKNFRLKALQTCQGRLLVSLADLLEFIDERVPTGPYNIKRNTSRTAWQLVHDEVKLTTTQPAELITVLWDIAKGYFENGISI